MIEILKYLGILLTALLGLLAVANDDKKEQTSKKHHKKTIVVLIVISGLISSILLYTSDKQTKVKETNLKSAITKLELDNDTLQNILRTTRDTLNYQIQQLQSENFLLSTQLTNTSLELNKNVLGSGLPIFELYGHTKSGFYYGNIKNESKYPMYDIYSIVTNWNEAIKCESSSENNLVVIDHDCFFRNSTEFKIQTIPPSSSHIIQENFNYQDKTIHLEIKTSSRNIKTVQQSVIWLRKNRCPQSYKIYTFKKDSWVLIESKSELKLSETYWSDHFPPLNNRKLRIK
jgi:hypothetical protein